MSEAFRDLPDLACEAVGGAAIAANDEFFAQKENLLRAHDLERSLPLLVVTRDGRAMPMTILGPKAAADQQAAPPPPMP